MEIRLATPADDVRRISRVYAQSWKAAYRGIVPQDYLDALEEARWSLALSQDDRYSLLLLDGGVCVGTSSVCSAREAEWEGWGEIVSLYLLPEYWGRGFGRELLGAALRELAGRGLSRAYLWVLEKNRRSRGFYEHCGFGLSGYSKTLTIGGRDLCAVQYANTQAATRPPASRNTTN